MPHTLEGSSISQDAPGGSLYTISQVARVLGISPARVRQWLRSGMIEPAGWIDNLPCFAFRHVAALKRLEELARNGVSVSRLRRSLKHLSRWWPEAAQCLSRLDLLDRRIVLRTDEGFLLQPDRQQVFDFCNEPADGPATVQPIEADSAEWLFQQAIEQEHQEEFVEAERLYRECLSRFGPEAGVVFNLANTLLAQGRVEAAIERYCQAIEMDPEFADAWVNLGCALADAGRDEDSRAAFRKAMALDPGNEAAIHNSQL